MASPFDFSKFLLTPPIPDMNTSHTSNRNANNNNNSSSNNVGGNDGNGQHGYGQGVHLAHGAGPPDYQQDTGQQQQQQQQQRQDASYQATNSNNNNNNATSQLQPRSDASSSTLRTQNNNSNSNQDTAGSTGDKLPAFDERDYGLDPSAFSSGVAFAMPSFLTASSNPGQFGSGPSMVDPSAFHPPPVSDSYTNQNLSIPPPGQMHSMQSQQQQMQSQQQQQPYMQDQSQQRGAMQNNNSSNGGAGKQKYVPDTNNPVYGIYGSSVISVNPDTSPFKLAPNSIQQSVLAAQPPASSMADSRGTTPDFDPKSLGLPVGNQLFPQPLPGLYSSSGFDMLGVLARVVARPNPQINIGPVDTSCSFLVVDARRYDMPIVFASDTFSRLTGYANSEIVGRNCRFLQAPDGHVGPGSRRKYTDGNAVYHLKTHVQSGKECQASIINYRKDGSPFINLVTVIPITWDTDEIAYFVGFQVDLVEQPNAILEKMRNGTYVVNYSLLPTSAPPVPMVPAAINNLLEANNQSKNVQAQDVMQDDGANTSALDFDFDSWQEQKPVKIVNPVASANARAAAAQSSMTIAPELLEVMGQAENVDDLDDDSAKKKWNKMLLDHTGDFVHVLSLKGSFLYVSPSVRQMLEYEPSDLIGKTIQSVCHPSDIVPLMRELKEASTVAHPIINLLYRFRRKSSGYVWMEAQGKLYLEQSKSRKCVILVGRERPVYKLSWRDLRAAGGLGEKEYWSKFSTDGMFLYNTPSIKGVLGHDAEAIRGTSLFKLADPEKGLELSKALQDAAAGISVRLHYKIRNAKGALVDVITNFYPNSQPKSPTKRTAGTVHPSIVAQTNEYASEMRRRATMSQKVSSLPGPRGVAPSPAPHGNQGSRPPYNRASSSAVRDMIVTTPEPRNAAGSGSDESGSNREGSNPPSVAGRSQTSASGSDSSAPSTFSAIPSTYKTLLQHPSLQSDNIFDELDTTRTTSWQYELHQLKLTNKKLKEELHMLQAAKRKRKKKEELQNLASQGFSPAPEMSGLQLSNTPAVKTCANCGRTDSPEWRVGPTGQRNLCNACGLRWAKATRTQRQSSHTPTSTSAPSSNNVSDMDTSTPSGYPSHLSASQQQQASGPFAPSRPHLPHNSSSSHLQHPTLH